MATRLRAKGYGHTVDAPNSAAALFTIWGSCGAMVNKIYAVTLKLHTVGKVLFVPRGFTMCLLCGYISGSS